MTRRASRRHAGLEHALQLHRSGDLKAAEAGYRRVLQGEPANGDALHLLGLISFETGDPRAAAALIATAIHARGPVPVFCENLALVLRRMGEPAKAAACYRKAIDGRPYRADLHFEMGCALLESGQTEAAAEAFEQAIRLEPRLTGAFPRSGTARAGVSQARRFAEAAARFEAGPFHGALARDPRSPGDCNNMGEALYAAGRYDEAAAAFEEALRRSAGHHRARANKARLDLLQGRFREGWKGYEYRAGAPVLGERRDPASFAGRAVLLRPEQGPGDAIQFVRYARLVREAGGSPVVECAPALERLFRSSGFTVAPAGSEPPAFDISVPLLGLPRIFGTELDSIPGETPYLRVEESLVREWASLAPAPARHVRVGIAWTDGPEHRGGGDRSLPPAEWGALREARDVSFFSLRMGCEAGGPDSPLPFVPLGREPGDFADAAALMMNLDLVISVDAPAAHLAGALARPVWTLLPFVPDWRWMLERADTPWYPSMRLFRQRERRDWRAVMEAVRTELDRIAR